MHSQSYVVREVLRGGVVVVYIQMIIMRAARFSSARDICVEGEQRFRLHVHAFPHRHIRAHIAEIMLSNYALM